MDFLPKDIENIILDYKYQLEDVENKEKHINKLLKIKNSKCNFYERKNNIRQAIKIIKRRDDIKKIYYDNSISNNHSDSFRREEDRDTYTYIYIVFNDNSFKRRKIIVKLNTNRRKKEEKERIKRNKINEIQRKIENQTIEKYGMDFFFEYIVPYKKQMINIYYKHIQENPDKGFNIKKINGKIFFDMN